MNKSELVDNISEGAGLSKADAERALNAFIDAVQGAVAADDKVTLPGFGSFSRSSRAARTGRNPRTGEPVQIAASKGVIVAADGGGKSKTVTQLIALGFFLGAPMAGRDWAYLVPTLNLSDFVEYVQKTGLVIFLIGTFLAVWSGWRYVQRYKGIVFSDADK